MIPLHQFTAPRKAAQKVDVPSRKRQRSEAAASSGEKRPANSSSESKQNATIARGRALTFESAPISDESDFDRDDVAEAEPKRKKTGKKQSDELPLQPRETHSKTSKIAVVRSNTMFDNQSSADELEIENEDSQTFAGFKMRIAKQEQARRQAEMNRRQTRKAAHSDRTHAGDRRDEPGGRTETASGFTQSIKLSKRDRLQFPESTDHSNEYESLPYHVLQRKFARVDVGEDGEEDWDMQELISSRHVPPNGEDIKEKGNVLPTDAAENQKNLLTLLVEGTRPRNAVAEKKQRRSRKGSSELCTGSGSASQSSEDSSPSQVVTSSATQHSQSMASVLERNLDDSSDEDEGLLRFDVQTGKLIQSVSSKAGSGAKHFEPGQSEEEDDFVPTLVDGPRPSKSNPREFFKHERERVEILTSLNAEAEAKAKQSGMKPAFRCSAVKQRKKPYNLDPNNISMVIPISISRFLRRYQRIGVQFFYDRYAGIKVDGIGVVRGGILGDDMGLGKTIQLSAVMEKTGTDLDTSIGRSRKSRARLRTSPCTPFTFGPTCLITCPKTLVTNWKREIETWTNLEFGVINSRPDLDGVIKNYKNGFLDLVLVPFDRLVGDIDVLSTLSFSIMIIDEAHSIKSPTAARTLAMKRISADCRFAMTGTLIQNRFQEMWSILDFVAPGLVGSYEQWTTIMAKTVDAGMDQKASIKDIARRKEITDGLHRFLLPLLFLRRTKAEVALELPTKNDQVVFCPLTPIQEMVYKRIAAQPDLQGFLKRQALCPKHPGKRVKDCCNPSTKFEAVDNGIVFRYIDAFKKVASHVGLVYSQPDDKSEQKKLCNRLLDVCFPVNRKDQIQQIGLLDEAELEGYVSKDLLNIAEELGPTYRDQKYRALRLYEASATPEFSGKWIILHSLLRSWKDDTVGKHKVLVFSSSVKLLKMLYDFIKLEYNCEMLHGGKKDEERLEAVDRFQTDDNVFVFLISTLAGGVGLNLTAANKVIIFDPNWNPAHDLQAMDRAFRMGQKRDVDVYRLVSLGTIEENIYERQMRKSAAMRIVYDDAMDSRVFVGNESGAGGDLWGAGNLFTYNPEGTSLQRAARLAFEEEQLENNLRGIIDTDAIKTVKIDTSYGEGTGDLEPRGTEKGTEMFKDLTEDATLLEAIGDLFPGLRREGVAKAQNKNSSTERFLVEQAAEDYRNNPAISDRPVNEYYQDAAVAQALAKRKGRDVKREGGGTKRDVKSTLAPRLNLPKAERHSGLVSDDE